MTMRWVATLADIYRSAWSRPTVHRKEVLCVQHLRCLAVLMVLLMHVEEVARRLPGWERFHSFFATHIAYTGPDMFFVISGFIMCYITFGSRFDARRWLVRRVIRIVPLYALFTAVVVGLWCYDPRMTMGSGEHTWGSVARSLLLLPQADLPLLFVGWTVEHEVVFYAIVFTMGALLSLGWLLRVLVLLSLAAFAKALWLRSTGFDFWDYHLLSLYMAQFAMGALVYRCRAQALRFGWRWPMAWAAGLFAIGVSFGASGAINMEQPLRVLAFGGAYSLLLLALLNRETRQREAGWLPARRGVSVSIGDASYSLYLSHPFVLAAFGKAIVLIAPPAWSAPLWLVAATLATFATGFAVHYLLERPLIEWGKRLSRDPEGSAERGVVNGRTESGHACTDRAG